MPTELSAIVNGNPVGLAEGGVHLSSMEATYSTCIPLLESTNSDPLSKNDMFPWNQTYDETTHDAGQGMEDILAALATDYPMTGGAVIVGPGYWNFYTEADAGNDAIIKMRTKQTIRGSTGNPNNVVLIRDADAVGHLIWCDPGAEAEDDELLSIHIRDIWLDGARNKGSVSADYDVINIVKPTSGSWGDVKAVIENTRISYGLRHNIYYSARGDSHIVKNFIQQCQDSAVKFEDAVDNYMLENVISGPGRHGLEVVDTTNLQSSGLQIYFPGGNSGNIWDGTAVGTIKSEGAGIYLENSNAIQLWRTRIEDTTGAGIRLAGCSGVMVEAYLNNIGTVGSFAQVTAGTKDFGATNITATVEGVPLIMFERTGGARPCNNVHIKGKVRQARGTQQIQYLVQVDPVNQNFRDYEDWDIDLEEFYNGSSNVEKKIDDVDAWTDNGQTNYWTDTFRLVSRSEPACFRRVSMKWRGKPMEAFHERTQNVRAEGHNCYDTLKKYSFSVAEVSANVTATTWGTSSDYQYCDLTVDTDLTGSITEKNAIAISGMGNSLLNDTLNIVSVSAGTIRVVVRPDYNDLTLPSNTTGETGTASGPACKLTLDDYVDDRTYTISIGTFNASAADMEVVLDDGDGSPSTVTLLAADGAADYEFRRGPNGWEQVV